MISVKDAEKLSFHPAYATRQPHDIILSGKGDTSRLSFYIDRNTLACPWGRPFADQLARHVPPEMICKISLSDVSTSAIFWFLKSLILVWLTPGDMPQAIEKLGDIVIDQEVLLGAALLARTFQSHGAIHGNLARLSKSAIEGEAERSYLNYAITTMGDDFDEHQMAAVLTTKYNIAQAPQPVMEFLERHAPEHLSRLRDLHFRCGHALARFHEAIFNLDPEPTFAIFHTDQGAFCIETERDPALRVKRRLLRGTERDEIMQFHDEFRWGLECHSCVMGAGAIFGDVLEWYSAYTDDYGCYCDSDYTANVRLFNSETDESEDT